MSASAPTRAGGEPPSRPHALVVDDEPRLVRLVSAYLEREGFSVSTAGDGEQALLLARERPPDVVILDLMLPGIDGIEVCRRIRAFSDAYIVMLSARAEEVDKIVGLSTGADDYVTKPFSPGELIARIRAMLRRPRAGQEAQEIRRLGDLVIDPVAREVARDEPGDRTHSPRVRPPGRPQRAAQGRLQPTAAPRAGLGPELVRRRARRGRPRRQPAAQAG